MSINRVKIQSVFQKAVLFVLVCLFILMFSSATYALTDVYVSDSTGNDATGTGAVGAPFKTIVKGLSSAEAGGTVHLFTGLYQGTGNKNITWPDLEGITLRSSTETSVCTIDAQDTGRIISVESTVQLTIEGITLTRGYIAGVGGGVYLPAGSTLNLERTKFISNESNTYGSAVYSEGSTVYAVDSAFISNEGVAYHGTWTVSNCAFSGNIVGVAYGASESDPIYWYAKDSTFINNSSNDGPVFNRMTGVVTNCVFDGNYGASGGGVAQTSWFDAYKCIFRNNSTGGNGGVINYTAFGDKWLNAENCLFINNSAGGSGGVLYYLKGRLTNCTFYGNSAAAGGVASRGGYGTLIILNCIFWGSGDPFSMAGGALNSIKYSDVEYEDWGDFTGNPTTGCIAADPIFASTSEAAQHYFRLGSGSPCKDSATFEGAPSDDYDGYPRPSGFATDMGALESHGPLIMVESPNGGEIYTCGQRIEITWRATDEIWGMPAKPITIRYSTNEGASYALITVEANTGISTWEPPLIASDQYFISIEAVNSSTESNSNYDVNDTAFEIIRLSTVYVSPSGSDTMGTGTVEAPFATIQKGLNCVAAGGTVEAFSGTYNEYDIAWPDSDNITLKASTESSVCTIDALSLGRVFNVSTAVDLTIEGITLQNGKVNNLTGGGILLTGGVNLRLIDVTIKACTEEANNYGGAVYANNSTVEAQNCIFDGNYAYGGGGVGGRGSWKVTDCIFRNNRAATGPGGAVAYQGDWNATDCIFSNNSSAYYGGIASQGIWTATNCVFFGNNAVEGGGVARLATWTVVNCVFFDNSAGNNGGVAYQGTWDGRNSIFWENTAGGTGPVFNGVSSTVKYSDSQTVLTGDGNINADPLFVSTDEADTDNFLRIGSYSPCIDSASTEAPSPDLAGNVRPNGLGNDMGVYEFQGPSISVEAPNGGEELAGGSVYQITWKATDEIYGIMHNSITIEYSADDGATWVYITTEAYTGLNGSYDWTVPMLSSDTCRISIEVTNASAEPISNRDISNASFTILNPIVYVSTSGSDETGTGTIEAPFKTIQKGLDSVAPTGEVRVMTGLYTGEVYDTKSMIGWPDRPDITLMISPDATGSVTIDAEAGRRCIDVPNPNSLTIEGITLRNGDPINENGGGINLAAGSRLFLEDVTIKNCTSEYISAGGMGGAINSYNSTVEARNCIFQNNYANVGGGVAVGGWWTAVNCIFADNYATGSWRGGVAYLGVWDVANCVFYKNKATLGGVARDATFNVVNSIFWANTTLFSGGSRTITYSDVQGGYAGVGNINADPLFVSTDEADAANFMRLGGGSPCIDIASLEAPSPDLAGNVRPRGFNNDMGAYEFQGPSIVLEAPKGGGSIAALSLYEITYEISPESVIDVYIRLSTNEGATWDTFITYESWSHSAGVNTYDWTVDVLVSTECLISIEAVDSASHKWNYDTSYATFEIHGPSISVEAPNGGELITALSLYEITYEISWESVSEVYIWLSTNGGSTWDTLITYESWSHPAGVATYEWTVDVLVSTECLISIEAVGSASSIWTNDASNAKFEIGMPISFADVYVSDGTGSDTTGNGTAGSPFQTISKGLSSVEAGGTVHVFTGLYQGASNRGLVWPNLEGITLKASTETSVCTVGRDHGHLIKYSTITN
ncbi:choice-of-anchor Q domain-containing protein [Candidatus Margulisiibacteriota bacterium]